MKCLCVFAGSSAGAPPAYVIAAQELGAALVRHRISLVYGGARVGLMGALADTVLAEGGQVTGVIPQALLAEEVAHYGVSDLRVVTSMHERKAPMADLADGFLALPGGLGTLEELFEVLTWGQLGLHHKPVGLLNVSGYFDGVLAFLAQAASEQFVKREHRSMILVEHTAEHLLYRVDTYVPPAVAKWIDDAAQT